MSHSAWHRRRIPKYRKPRQGTHFHSERVVPDKDRVSAILGQVDDAVQESTMALARALGCGRHAASALKEGRALPSAIVDEVERNVFHMEDGTMRARMLSMLGWNRKAAASFIARMQTLAELVQTYRSQLPVPSGDMTVYTFQPRLMVKVMTLAIEQAYWTFVRLHDECPEFDKLVFAKAPELLREVEALPKGVWAVNLQRLNHLGSL